MRGHVLVLCAVGVLSPATVRAEDTAPDVDPDPLNASNPVPAAPPAPLVMPELVPRTRITISSMVSSALLVNELVFGLSGTYTNPSLGGLELFGDAKTRLGGIVPIDGSAEGQGGGLAFSNARVGARYHVAMDAVRIAPALWAWLPTSNIEPANHEAWEQMSGVMDNRSFGHGYGSALGVGLDAALHLDSTFVQLETGVSLVSDRGPQLDDVFAALGVGTQVTAKTSFLSEFRMEVLPTRQRLYGPAIGFGRGDGETWSWRMRFHPYVFNGEWGGLAIGIDVVRRIP